MKNDKYFFEDEDINKEEFIDKLGKAIDKELRSLPADGIFKVQISKHISAEDKAETKRMLEYMAEAIGRPDIKILVIDVGDLN